MYNSLVYLLFLFEHFLCYDDRQFSWNLMHFTCPKLLFESIIYHVFTHNISYQIVLTNSIMVLIKRTCFSLWLACFWSEDRNF